MGLSIRYYTFVTADEANAPLIYAAISAKCSDDGQSSMLVMRFPRYFVFLGFVTVGNSTLCHISFESQVACIA